MSQRVFEGIKVADFSWAAVGGYTVAHLALGGATVVHVESGDRPCALRTMAPFKDGKPGLDRSGFFASFHQNLYSMALNLTHPKAIDVARRLVSWSDIVVENFRAGVIDHLGLGYEKLKKSKPDIIMLSASAQGRGGPHSQHPSLGFHLVGSVGFPHFTGWPDRGPLPLAMAYTDVITPYFATTALIAALDYRRRTGKGQYLDLSQMESSIHFLAAAVLDYTANGRVGNRLGNSSPSAAPHGAYRCQGVDRWCVIGVFNDGEWRNFCQAANKPEYAEQARFATLLGRKENEDEINKIIEEWTINLKPEEVMVRLQAVGVAAGVVQNAEDLYKDPQLRQRRAFSEIPHRVLGDQFCFEEPFKLSRTPSGTTSPSPCLGEHTEYVCSKFLNMTDKEFIALVNEGILQ